MSQVSVKQKRKCYSHTACVPVLFLHFKYNFNISSANFLGKHQTKTTLGEKTAFISSNSDKGNFQRHSLSQAKILFQRMYFCKERQAADALFRSSAGSMETRGWSLWRWHSEELCYRNKWSSAWVNMLFAISKQKPASIHRQKGY